MIDQDSPGSGEEIREDAKLESSGEQISDPHSDQESNRANTCDDSASDSASASTVDVAAQESESKLETKTAPGKPPSARKQFQLSDLWWVPASFVVPFTTLALYLTAQNAFAPKLCLRSGLVGTAMAVVIFVLWKIDTKITGFRAPDVSTELVLRMLGMMLWLVWVGAGHVVLLATDEVYPPIDLTTYNGGRDRHHCVADESANKRLKVNLPGPLS